MANRDEMSFSRAFADARREMGAGKTFTWRGNRYTTDLAEEAPRRRAGPATENAPARSSRPQARPSMAPEESPRPRSRRSIGENIPPLASEFERSSRRVQRDPQDASPTTRARPPVRRDAQDMPPSISRVIADAPTAAARAEAQRIADEGMERRMPLRSLLARIRDSIQSRREGASSGNAAARSEAAATAAGARRQAAQEARERRAAGMARGGMVKNGKTDRRGKGMFYDSKSPRGYK